MGAIHSIQNLLGHTLGQCTQSKEKQQSGKASKLLKWSSLSPRLYKIQHPQSHSSRGTHTATTGAHTHTHHLTQAIPASKGIPALITDPPKFHNNPQYREVCN